MHLNIMKTMGKIPGGLLIVPLLITASINTWAPGLLTIGGPHEAVFKTGMMAVVGMLLFASGANLQIKQLKALLKSGGVYALLKLVLVFGCSYLFMVLFGLEGIAGISAVAFVGAIFSMNPGTYMSLAQDYGDETEKTMYILTALFCTQAIGIIALNLSSGSSFDIMSVVNVLTPFIIGFILGNLDPAIGKFLAPFQGIAVPFMGFVFGGMIDLRLAFTSGLSGILLAVVVIVLNVVVMAFIGDRLILKKPGWCGVALCGISGVACSIPALMAMDNPAFAPYVGVATAQIAMVLVITSIGVPFIAKAFVKKWGTSQVEGAVPHMEGAGSEGRIEKGGPELPDEAVAEQA